MNHENWDDEKIDKLLSNAPKIHDQRSKDEIFQRLKEDGLFDEEPNDIVNKGNKIKKKIHWMPLVVTFVALFMMVIFLPILMKSIIPSSNLSFEKSNDFQDTSNEQYYSTEKKSVLEKEETAQMSNADVASIRSAAYPEDLEGTHIFKLGVASHDADSIPITIFIPEEKIQEIFIKQNPTGIELYNYFAPLVKEEEIGFVDYHPLEGEVIEKDGFVYHILPNEQKYDLGSSSFSTYISVLIDTFSGVYKGVAIVNEKGEDFLFSEVGEEFEPLEFNDSLTQYNYFKYDQGNAQYLTPNFRTTYSSVEEAINSMKDETNDIYKSVILPNVTYNVTVEDKTVVVTFEESLDLFAYDQQDAMQMIEGMLLTAASFELNVRFKNIMQEEWGGFNFSQVLPKPIGANKISFEQIFHQYE